MKLTKSYSNNKKLPTNSRKLVLFRSRKKAINKLIRRSSRKRNFKKLLQFLRSMVLKFLWQRKSTREKRNKARKKTLHQ